MELSVYLFDGITNVTEIGKDTKLEDSIDLGFILFCLT